MMPNDTFSFHDIVVTLVTRLIQLRLETLREMEVQLAGKKPGEENFLLDGVILALAFKEANVPEETIKAFVRSVMEGKP
jgi:hypothetical protein